MAKNYKKPPADAGRNGDTVLGHLTRGEMVIPVALLDADDGYLRQMLSGMMQEMDINPAQFTVGDKANKINPETGYPEFGWFKKIVKSVKNVVKKVVSTVGAAVGLAPKAAAPSQAEAPSTGQKYTAADTEMSQEEADVKKKSSALRRKSRGKRRLRIDGNSSVGTGGSGSGVNAGSSSGVNVPKG